ncbi:MAG TPA: response regulator [Candidatus Bathyarchaeia archaeon]|nr:response regulator [Candidatus Bathyarchaeia archaeon]
MSRRDPSVLLVEDDNDLRRIIAHHLVAHGYDVKEAANAEDAERLLAEGPRPRVILLDIDLPGRTGWDLLQGAALGCAGSPPVVISSAVTIDPRRLSECAVAGYLPKPYALETLMDTLSGVLNRDEVPRP